MSAGPAAACPKREPVEFSQRARQGEAAAVGLGDARVEALDAVHWRLDGALGDQNRCTGPGDVMPRQIDAVHILCLNLDGPANGGELKGRSGSNLRDRDCGDGFAVGSFEPEFVVINACSRRACPIETPGPVRGKDVGELIPTGTGFDRCTQELPISEVRRTPNAVDGASSAGKVHFKNAIGVPA